jgi:hypothetical protein
MGELQTEKQKAIKEYSKMVAVINRHYNVVYEDLDKKTQKYLRYKYACVSSHADCPEILKHKTIDDFSWCHIKCRYSYDYVPD